MFVVAFCLSVRLRFLEKSSDERQARFIYSKYYKPGNFVVQMRKWFVLGAIGVAAILFAIAIVFNNGIAALIAFVLLVIALASRYFVK